MSPRYWLGLCGTLLVAPAVASNVATQTITITVLPLVSLSAPQGGEITLQAAAPGSSERYQPVRVVQRSGLCLFHNLPGARRVEAEAAVFGGANDLDLTCSTTGGAGAQLVRGGRSQGPQAITPELAAGRHSLDLLWEVAATSPGTSVGQYHCEVRFTVTE